MEILKILNVEYERVGWFSQTHSYFSLDGKYEWRSIESIPFEHAQHIKEEIKRFNPKDILLDKSLDLVTARQYFADRGFSNEFVHYVFLGTVIYFFPGHTLSHYLDSPIRTLIAASFFPGLMKGDKPLCRLKNGSGLYAQKFKEYLESKGVTFQMSSRAHVVTRTASTTVLDINGQEESFDHLVIATAPWDALRVLGDCATEQEKQALGSFESTLGTVCTYPIFIIQINIS